jgi:hypothetical protein
LITSPTTITTAEATSTGYSTSVSPNVLLLTGIF